MSSRKTLAMAVVLLVVWIFSIYTTARSTSTLRKDIAAMSAQGNKLADMAERFLEERNECRTKLKGCKNAKMELFHMYTSCEEEYGRLQKWKGKR